MATVCVRFHDGGHERKQQLCEFLGGGVGCLGDHILPSPIPFKLEWKLFCISRLAGNKKQPSQVCGY